jgi:radical SAM protein with 4Fe4S-binding SPASM domain
MKGWLRNQRYINVAMDLSSTCDIQCIECFRAVVEPPRAKVSLDQIGKLERELFPYINQLALSCTGEPLYLKNFPAGLEAAKRAGVPFVRIQSNGTHLDEERRKMLVDLELDLIGISLDAATKDSFEKIRYGAEWDTVIPNIRELVKLRNSMGRTKPHVALNFAIMNQNADEAVEFIHLGKEIGADSISFSHLVLETWEMKDWSLIYDAPRANALFARLREEGPRTGISISVPDDVPGEIRPFSGELLENPSYQGRCGAAIEPWAFLLPNGDLYVCQNVREDGPVGNVFEKPFPEIWYGYANQHFRKEALKGNVAGCDQCKIYWWTTDTGNEMSYLAKRLTTVAARDQDQEWFRASKPGARAAEPRQELAPLASSVASLRG